MPLAMHKDAMGAHLASVAAERQGRFWEFHDRLFANQSQLKLDDLKRHARALGLDMNRFEKDLVDLEIKKRVEADMAEARALGVTGTPGFFVNGRNLSGNQPLEAFVRVIDEELQGTR